MSDLREEISECLDQLKDALDVITERDKRIAELEAQNKRLKKWEEWAKSMLNTS